MRALLAIAFLTSTALACPDISGRYNVCVSSSGETGNSKDVVIEQKVINKIHNITITSTDEETQQRSSDSYKADGKTWMTKTTDPETGFVLVSHTSTTCNDQFISIKSSMTLNGEHMSTMNLKMTKINGELIQEISGDSLGSEISDKVNCR